MIRLILVDDEEPARIRLRQLLAPHTDVEIVGEAASGAQAMELIRAVAPDAVLLDIQMPGSSGLDVAACLAAPRPHIIFCTAYDQHAVDAFELHALDYLLKPISRARLAKALDRIRALSAVPEERINAASDGARSGEPARFLVRNATHYLVVPEERVLYFLSEDGLTWLVGAGAKYWMDPTLNDLEQRLPAARFFRASRSALLALSAVSEVFPMPGGNGEVLLKNGDRVEVSRRRFRDLLDALQPPRQ